MYVYVCIQIPAKHSQQQQCRLAFVLRVVTKFGTHIHTYIHVCICMHTDTCKAFSAAAVSTCICIESRDDIFKTHTCIHTCMYMYVCIYLQSILSSSGVDLQVIHAIQIHTHSLTRIHTHTCKAFSAAAVSTCICMDSSDEIFEFNSST